MIREMQLKITPPAKKKNKQINKHWQGCEETVVLCVTCVLNFSKVLNDNERRGKWARHNL